MTCLSLLITLPVFAQQTSSPSLISVETSSDNYEEGETVVISGKVTTVILETPVTIIIFHGGNVIEIAQLSVAQDGSFTHTILAQGPLWQNEGKYIVKASYGEVNSAESSFQFISQKTATETTDTFEVDAGSSGTFDVPYTIVGGTVSNMVVDIDGFALILIIDSTRSGTLTIDLPRISIDAKKSDGTDDTYIILVDGIEVPYQEVGTDENSRILKIEFDEGNSDIEIIGTFVVPEFGTIVVLILAATITVTILITRKNLPLSLVKI